MNRLTHDERTAVISCLIEGCSIRSTVRMTGTSKKAIMRLLGEVGDVCLKYQDTAFRNLHSQRIQVDEMWSYVGAKQKNVQPHHFEDGGYAGDVWLWVALDADTKLVPCWMLGRRDAVAARDFMEDLASRLATRIQLTTDGHRAYLAAVPAAFGNDVDYAMLVKIYGESAEGQKRYSPAECIACEKHPLTGSPNPAHISTSYVERQNLTVRMSNRRFTRLTNAFSKSLENHAAAVALHYFAYNFVKINRTLRVTPAMAAGVTDRPWEVSDIVALLEASERRLERAA